MNLHPGSRESRALAIALPITLIAVLTLVIGFGLNARFSAVNDSMADMRFQKEKYLTLSNNRGRIETMLTQVKRWPSMDGYYLSGATTAVAAAELEQQLKKVVAARKGTIVSTQVLTRAEENGLQNVVIQVRLRASLPGLLQILHNLETGKPSLFVNNLSVAARTVSARNNTASSMARELDVRFDLTGYLKGVAP
jgi:general secretion pathway protein M